MPDIYDLRPFISSGDGQHNTAPKSVHSKGKKGSISIEIKERSGLANTKQSTIESASTLCAKDAKLGEKKVKKKHIISQIL